MFGAVILIPLSVFLIRALLDEPSPLDMFLSALLLLALLAWLPSPRMRVELGPDGIYFKRPAFHTTRIGFDEITYIEQATYRQQWDIRYRTGFLRPSVLAVPDPVFPIGQGLVLRVHGSAGPWYLPPVRYEWILFRVGDTVALLSALEAAGVPVRRLDTHVK